MKGIKGILYGMLFISIAIPAVYFATYYAGIWLANHF